MTSHVISKPASMSRVAVVAAAALLLGGCAGGAPEPAASPDTTQSATASVSASPTPTATATPAYKPASAAGPAQNVPLPVLPAVAKTETKEGLEAFAKYWFQLLSYGYETGDVKPLSQITSSSCVMCERAKQVQVGWHQEGRWLAGGRVTTPVVNTTFRVASDGNYQVAVQVRQEALSYYNSDGTLDSAEQKPMDSGSLMLVDFRDGAWFVNTVEPISG